MIFLKYMFVFVVVYLDLKLLEMTNKKIKNRYNTSYKDELYCSYYYEDVKENSKIFKNINFIKKNLFIINYFY